MYHLCTLSVTIGYDKAFDSFRVQQQAIVDPAKLISIIHWLPSSNKGLKLRLQLQQLPSCCCMLRQEITPAQP